MNREKGERGGREREREWGESARERLHFQCGFPKKIDRIRTNVCWFVISGFVSTQTRV